MPSRTEFLEGLVPITLTGEDEDCVICYSTLTTAVTLPCNHTYDRECLTQWISTRGVNTCPMCRRALFDLDSDEIDDDDDDDEDDSDDDDDDEDDDGITITSPFGELGTAEHEDTMQSVLQNSGLPQSGSLERFELEDFDLGDFSEDEIYRARLDVVEHLRRGWGETNQGELFVVSDDGERGYVLHGDILIDFTPTLRAQVVALGYLVPATAMATGSPPDTYEVALEELVTAMTVLGHVLKDFSGRSTDINALPTALRDGVAEELAMNGHTQNVFLRDHEESGGRNFRKRDFDAIIDCVCYFVWKQQQTPDDDDNEEEEEDHVV